MNSGLPLLIALAGALATALAGCRPSGDSPIGVTVIGPAPSLGDTAWQLTAPDAVLRDAVAQGLVRFDSRGQIEPGLAERWNVSDDGLSYVFRLQSGDWSDGRPIRARDVARLLKQQIARTSLNPLADTLGAVDDVVAMTGRVIEIRLVAPRPNLLQLLAQPELALVSNGAGSGPFTRRDDKPEHGETSALLLERKVMDFEADAERTERVRLAASPVREAVNGFANGHSDLVLGGSAIDLPYALALKLPRGSLHFDPVIGLFGLAPARATGPIADPDFRRFLAHLIDRGALVSALRVDGLVGRATLLQAGLDGLPAPVQPAWLALTGAQRQAALVAESNRLFGKAGRPALAIMMPDGPGAEIIFNRLAIDFGFSGIKLVRSARAIPADLKLVDLAAPSTSPAWFVREFRCGLAPLCAPTMTSLVDQARTTADAGERARLLAAAAAVVDDQALFIPLAAPVRWSLVGKRAVGYDDNLFARHSLTGLDQPGRGDN